MYSIIWWPWQQHKRRRASTPEESFQVVYAASHWVAAACVDEQVMIANSIGDTLSPIRNAAVAYWPSNGQPGRLRPASQPAGLRTVCSRIPVRMGH